MKKQRFQWMMAAILTICGTAMLTSCIDKDDNPTPTPTGVEQPENPTEDAVSVTINKSYVMYGKFDEEFGDALGRRIQGTMTSPSMADVFVVDPSAVNNSDIMTTEELKTIIRRTESGEASLVLTKATFREFYDWAQIYVMGYLLMELENYYGDLGYDSPEAAPARRKVANIMRNAYMAGQKQTATTRGTTVNNIELDWEHVNTWPEEQQNAVMFDGFAQSGDNELFIMNATATLNADAEVRHPQSDYEWGHKADAMVDWLNRQGKEDAQTRAGLKRFAQAVTKANGDVAVSDLMSAQTKDFVFDYSYPNPAKASPAVAHSAIKIQYRAYSIYDFAGDIEYYQVHQNITVMNDKIHTVQNDNNWVFREDGAGYNLARGAWMKSIDTKMWLDGNGGTISVITAAPLNENGSSSGSQSDGGSKTTTTGTSNGASIGVSFGGSWGGGFAASMNFTYTHTSSYSEANGTTWNTSTNWSTKDLSTILTLGNDAKGTVSWTHAGYTPTNSSSTASDNVKPLLKSTCVTDENVLWKINNPSGTYSLGASLNVVSEIAKVNKNWDTTHGFETCDNKHSISFDLNTPDRFKRQWNNVIYDYGSVTGDIELTSYLDNYIETTYGYNSACFCWAGMFISTEATADGSDNARAVFQTFKNSIRGMKQQLYAKGFRGNLVFGLKLNGRQDLVDYITLDLNAEDYKVGETLSGQVNGYSLSFMVTNKLELELTSVPEDFKGDLVIPQTLLDGNFNVTSLGNACALGRTGITSVTIPPSVRTIGKEALAQLKITEINIPEGVETISEWAFHANDLVKKVYLPSTLKTLGKKAFGDMNNLAEVHIKATTPPSIGEGCFSCYQTAMLYVPKGCKTTYTYFNPFTLSGWTEWAAFTNVVEE